MGHPDLFGWSVTLQYQLGNRKDSHPNLYSLVHSANFSLDFWRESLIEATEFRLKVELNGCEAGRRPFNIDVFAYRATSEIEECLKEYRRIAICWDY